MRGAPAIGVVAALSLAVDLHRMTFTSTDELVKYVTEKMEYLVSARPTAVNILDARRKFAQLLANWTTAPGADVNDVKNKYD